MGIKVYDPNAEGGYRAATQEDLNALHAFAGDKGDGCLDILGAAVLAAVTLLATLAALIGTLPA